MAKVNLPSVVSGYNLQKINDNDQAIATELNENVLYRRSPKGEPNEMHNNLDMNSNRIYNLPAPGFDHEPVRLIDINNLIFNSGNQTEAKNVQFDPYKSLESTNVQGAIYELEDSKLGTPELADLEDFHKGAGYIPSTARTISVIADLRQMPSDVNNLVNVLGYYEEGDGGGGQYYLDSSDTTSVDDGGSIIVSTEGGRWKLLNRGKVYVEQFGAVGDGVTDDEPAINAAVAFVSSLHGGDVMFRSKVYAVGDTIKIVTSAVGLIGEGSETYTAGDYGTTLKWIGASLKPFIWFEKVDAPRFRAIALDCNSLASVGLRVQSSHFGIYDNFAIRDFTGVGFQGLCSAGASNWSNGNKVSNFLITSYQNGVDGFSLNGVAEDNNDWWNNTFHTGIVQVGRSATESRAAHLLFCDSNTFTEVDFSVAQGGTGDGLGILFDSSIISGYPQNNAFYGCSIFNMGLFEPGETVVGRNLFMFHPSKDGESILNHTKIVGYSDEGDFFGGYLGVKGTYPKLRLSTHSSGISYDLLMNATDTVDGGFQIVRTSAGGASAVVFQVEDSGETSIFVAGVGLRQVSAGAADSAGSGYRTLRVVN